MTHRLFTALGTSACLAAALLTATAAAFRAFDRALSDFSVDTANVPVQWVADFYGEHDL